ncbi:hypothetical protein [Azospirillum argentinense]
MIAADMTLRAVQRAVAETFACLEHPVEAVLLRDETGTEFLEVLGSARLWRHGPKIAVLDVSCPSWVETDEDEAAWEAELASRKPGLLHADTVAEAVSATFDLISGALTPDEIEVVVERLDSKLVALVEAETT